MLAMRILIVISLALCGCIVEAPTSSRSEATGRQVMGKVPAATVNVGANLEGKLEIVSARLDPGRAPVGEAMKITTTFKVLEPLERDYAIFVHVEDSNGRMERVNLDHAPSRPTSEWKQGETIEDTIQLFVPPGQGIRALNVWTGLWHSPTDSRLKLSNPGAVRNDGRDRILLATVPVQN
jgi:hypothetical protein